MRSLLGTLRVVVVLAGLLMAVLPAPSSALSVTDRVVMQSADPDPYMADPLGLVANFGLTSYRTTAPDRFEVWVCDEAHGSLDLTPENVTGLLNAELPPYYSWMSEGEYALSFVPGGYVQANYQQDCLTSVSNRSTGGNHAAIVVSTLHIDDASNVWSWGGPGSYCWDSVSINWCHDLYPDSGREVWMGWFTNVGVRWSPIALSSIENGIGSLDNLRALNLIYTVAHEIGHTLSWPHSFTGETVNDDGTIDEYDNPMDVMSRGPTARYEDNRGWSIRPVLAGTHVLNRYAAGWIQPDQVEIHPWDHVSLHAINPIGSTGTQMVIMHWSTGMFHSIGVRVQESYDSLIQKEGVEVYLIDQSAAQCDNPYRDACWGADRRTKPALSGADDPVLHVLGLHEGIYWGDSETDPDRYELDVIERYGDTFIIEIAPGDDYPTFHRRTLQRLLLRSGEVGSIMGDHSRRRRRTVRGSVRSEARRNDNFPVPSLRTGRVHNRPVRRQLPLHRCPRGPLGQHPDRLGLRKPHHHWNRERPIRDGPHPYQRTNHGIPLPRGRRTSQRHSGQRPL